MTITGGSALAEGDIDRMVKDAESYAEEDRKRREAVETRNQAEQLVNQTEKVLSEQGDKLTDDEKSPIETAMAELKEAVASEDTSTEDLRSKMESLAQVSQGAFTRMYQEAADQAQATGTGQATQDVADDEEVVDAEIIDEGDES